MKQFLIYVLPAVVALAACKKKQPAQQESNSVKLVTLEVSSPQIAVSSSATTLTAPVALSTPAEFTLSGSPVKANGTATVTVENAQLPLMAMKGSVVGVVKLTLTDLVAADAVSVQLKEAARGDAVVQVVPPVLTNALKDGKLAAPLTTTATSVTRAEGSGNELFLLFQSGVNGFSEADGAVVEITAKDTKFTVTITGKGSKAKAENQTTVNTMMRTIGEEKIASIKEMAKICAPAALTANSAEFTFLNRARATTVGLTSVEDLNIVIANGKGGCFKAASGGKIGIVQLFFSSAKKLAAVEGTSTGSGVTFSAKIGSVFADGSNCKVALVNKKPAVEQMLFANNVLKDALNATGDNGGKDKWHNYANNNGGSNTSTTWLLFQGSTTAFGANDAVIVEITATAGAGADMATKTFTVGISVAPAAKS